MKRKGLIRIGVIADTHGLFDPAIARHFAGVDHIVHAGDIGARFVIEQLEAIAPVTAVSGNVDQFEQSGFPCQTVIRVGGVTIAVRHILFERGTLTREARAWLDRVQPDVCVFGHSHAPTIARYGHTVLFNPGSAGPRRFSLPRGIGLLTVDQEKVEPCLVRLSNRVAATRLRATRGAAPV